VTTEELEKRINRLDRLGRGMAKEAALIRAADDPPLRQERLAYLAAVGDALEGVERARVTPARAVLRIRRDGTQPAA
jgi:hypothetical protein